jgi:alpha-galactosidase
VPAGWTVTASGPTRRSLSSDASLRTSWNVQVPDGTPAGRYPITVTATFTWGEGRHGRTASAASELIGVVVIAPRDGTSPLSTVAPVSSTNAAGPVELDQSNGGANQGDGNLITVGGVVYTRGLGTAAPGEILYYLGGRCSKLTTGVALDDDTATGSAVFTISADDHVVASATAAAGGGIQTLTADLTGVSWLVLATDSGSTSGGEHADWIAPELVCGATTDPTVVDTTIFSFETGIDDFTTANVDTVSTMTQSAAFHTDGSHGLLVTSPADGNWYGRPLDAPLDLTGKSLLKYDVKTGVNGAVGEIALQVGPDWMWCQGGLWTWTNPSSSQTVARKLSQITCPAGAALDPSQIHAVWVFLKDGTFNIDNVRAE